MEQTSQQQTNNLDMPKNTHALIVKKLFQYNEQKLKNIQDFYSIYFCIQTICASTEYRLDAKQIAYRNMLFKDYLSGALSRAKDKIKNIKFEDETTKYKALQTAYNEERLPALLELKRLIDIDMKNIVSPYLQRTYHLPQENIREVNSGKHIIGVFKNVYDL